MVVTSCVVGKCSTGYHRFFQFRIRFLTVRADRVDSVFGVHFLTTLEYDRVFASQCDSLFTFTLPHCGTPQEELTIHLVLEAGVVKP